MKLNVQLATAPDREYEVAEVWFGDEMMAEVNRESGPCTLEIYPRDDRLPWRVRLDEFLECIERARAALCE